MLNIKKLLIVSLFFGFVLFISGCEEGIQMAPSNYNLIEVPSDPDGPWSQGGGGMYGGYDSTLTGVCDNLQGTCGSSSGNNSVEAYCSDNPYLDCAEGDSCYVNSESPVCGISHGELGDCYCLGDGICDDSFGEPITSEDCESCITGTTQSCNLPQAPGTCGQCNVGLKTCINNQWGNCEQIVYPITEICDNGQDDDCDCTADENEAECQEDCGDNIIQTPNDDGLNETCDRNNLNDHNCTTIPGGFDGGTLGCLDDCTAFDTSGCYNDEDLVCGDNIIQTPNTAGLNEVCDGSALGNVTCNDFSSDIFVDSNYNMPGLISVNGPAVHAGNCVYDECTESEYLQILEDKFLNKYIRIDDEIMFVTGIRIDDDYSGSWMGYLEIDRGMKDTTASSHYSGSDIYVSLEFDGGTLSCLTDCTGFDTSECTLIMPECEIVDAYLGENHDNDMVHAGELINLHVIGNEYCDGETIGQFGYEPDDSDSCIVGWWSLEYGDAQGMRILPYWGITFTGNVATVPIAVAYIRPLEEGCDNPRYALYSQKWGRVLPDYVEVFPASTAPICKFNGTDENHVCIAKDIEGYTQSGKNILWYANGDMACESAGKVCEDVEHYSLQRDQWERIAWLQGGYADCTNSLYTWGDFVDGHRAVCGELRENSSKKSPERNGFIEWIVNLFN
jgi:hypothetical protein